MGAFAPPLPAGDKDCYISDHTDIAMGLNAASKNQADAKKFLDWLTTPEFATLYANALPGFFPLSNEPVTIKDDLAATMVVAQGLQVDDPQLLPDPLARHAEPGERAVERLGAGDQRRDDARSRRQAAAGRARQVV